VAIGKAYTNTLSLHVDTLQTLYAVKSRASLMVETSSRPSIGHPSQYLQYRALDWAPVSLPSQPDCLTFPFRPPAATLTSPAPAFMVATLEHLRRHALRVYQDEGTVLLF
jgi:hypothetical protein